MVSPVTNVYLYPQKTADADWPEEVLEALWGLEAGCEVCDVIEGARYYALEPGQAYEDMEVLWRAAREGFINIATFHECSCSPVFSEPWYEASFLGLDDGGRLREGSKIVTNEVYYPVFATDGEADYEANLASFRRFYEEVVQTLDEVRTSRGAFPADAFADL